MSIKRQTGFTIVEVMLFLGITGLIMAFMLNGVGSQLNERRYQDATNSLVSFMQNQYNLVANVNNSRAKGVSFGSCDTSHVAGTSDCTVVGRILHAGSLDGDTQQITSSWVIATKDVAALIDSVHVLQDAELVAATDVDTYDVAWGTKLVKAADHTQPLSLTVLIVRIPTTGIVHTYINPGRNISPSDIIAAADNVTSDFRLCVDPVGLLNASADPAGVMIRKDATNTSGVEFVPQGKCA
jgi:type II secretory pathway pseudopilin PulG